MAILDRKKKQKEEGSSSGPPKKAPEYNPRWMGYTAIGLTSLIDFSAGCNVAASMEFSGNPGMAQAWGIISCLLVIFILALDRSQCFIDKFNYTKLWDGRFEGYTLLLLTVFWIFGVGFITQVDGIGYLTLNIYFSTWLTLFGCVYTLNLWSGAHDILSIGELTGLSATLKSWWVLFLTSLVVTGTSINYIGSFKYAGAGANWGLSVGLVSVILSVAWISVHYKFIECVTQGGWSELGCAFIVSILWTIAVPMITQDGGIGSTIVGSGCPESSVTGDDSSEFIHNGCFVLVELDVGGTIEVHNATCTNVLELEIPGSNLYCFTWAALASAVHVCFRWKAAQALQFAQAQNEKVSNNQAQQSSGQGGSREKDQNNNNVDEDDDDLDEFEDASTY